ncbi:hypothetical protein MRX96_021477 [Rhipicephalus microplus]
MVVHFTRHYSLGVNLLLSKKLPPRPGIVAEITMESTRSLTEEAGSSKQRREHGPESVDAGVGAATQLDLPGSSNHERDRAAAATKVWLVSAQAKLRLVLGSATVRRALFRLSPSSRSLSSSLRMPRASSSSPTGSRTPTIHHLGRVG